MISSFDDIIPIDHEQEDAPVGVLLINTGTPLQPTPRAVRKYLSKFLMDPRIVPMNRTMWWLLLHACILRVRGKRSAKKYQAIWTDEGFPYRNDHEKVVQGLNGYYAAQGRQVIVTYAMNYSEPSAEDALAKLRASGARRLVVLPLYPQSAFSTTSAAVDAVKAACDHKNWHPPMKIIDNYSEDPFYIKAIAASIKNAGFDVESDDRLMLSFHSIPLADIEAGDTYELQVDATALAIAGELELDRKRWTISYQSRFDKGRTWLSPFTRKTLQTWAQSGEQSRVFLVCPNFAIDNLETLYDVEYEIKPEYLDARAEAERAAHSAHGGSAPEAGDVEDASMLGTPDVKERVRMHDAADGASYGQDEAFIYVPCLNRSKAHIKVLTHVLEPYL